MPRVKLGRDKRLEAERQARKGLEDLFYGEIGRKRTSVAAVASRTEYSGKTLYRRLKEPDSFCLKELRQTRQALGISEDQLLEALRPWI